MTAAPPRPEADLREPPVSPWRNRPFVLLWTAQAISQTAQNAIWYGMMVLVQTRSHSSTQLSLAIMTLIVPSVLFGIIAGAYVDRWDKRLVLVGTNLIRAVVTLGYIVFAGFLPLVYVVNFVFSTVSQFFAPAEAAMIPALVPRRGLMQANSLFHLTFTASQLLGIVLLGPLIVNLFSVDGLFACVSALIGICALLVWPLPRGHGAPVDASEQPRSFRGLWKDIHELGRFMQADRVAWLAVLHWTLGASLGIVIAMLAPAFSENILGIRAEDSVFVLAPAGVGMVLGTILLGRFGQRWPGHRLIEVGLFVVGVSLTALGVIRPLANAIAGAPTAPYDPTPGGPGMWLIGTVMAITLIAGMAFVAVIVAAQTIIQERAPVAIRGRVFAVQLMLSNAVSIVPLVFLGGLADLIGVGRTMALLGLLLFVVAVLTVRAHRAIEPATSAR